MRFILSKPQQLELAQAENQAADLSAKDQCTKHVNLYASLVHVNQNPDVYAVDITLYVGDWFSSDATIKSYTNGREL